MLRIHRRSMLTWLAVPLLVGFSTSPVTAQSGIDVNEAERMLDLNMVQLKDQLINGLRLTTPEQRQYIGVVIQAVENGQIPRAMVNVVYVWAKERNPKFPFPYFRIALRILAERRGVALP